MWRDVTSSKTWGTFHKKFQNSSPLTLEILLINKSNIHKLWNIKTLKGIAPFQLYYSMSLWSIGSINDSSNFHMIMKTSSQNESETAMVSHALCCVKETELNQGNWSQINFIAFGKEIKISVEMHQTNLSYQSHDINSLALLFFINLWYTLTTFYDFNENL